jgi:hypothetical protein
MQHAVGMKRMATVLAVCALGGVVASSADGATPQVCSPIANPYAGSRYEGIDLRRIRATGVACGSARRVVRGAHRKALGQTPPPNGVRTFTWGGWRVTGDLRPAVDRYVAVRAGKRISWVF